MNRPKLTEDNFLKHLFSPKKHLLPTGLRKRPVTASKGRTRARVAAYNRMSAKNQEVLYRSGQRDAYLAGTGNLKDARITLRDRAVDKGFAKPLRNARGKGTVEIGYTQAQLVVSHVIQSLRGAGKTVNADRVAKHVPHMKPSDLALARKWTVGKIKHYASDSDNEVIIEGERFNPLWYR